MNILRLCRYEAFTLEPMAQVGDSVAHQAFRYKVADMLNSSH